MKFYYYYNYGDGRNVGVSKKILSQCNYLIKNGIDVQLILIGGETIDDPDQKFIKVIRILEFDLCTRSNILVRIRRQYELRKIFTTLIDSASSSDIFYSRYPYPLFYLLWPFSRRQRKCKIVNEHNTIEHKEFKLVGSRLPWLIDLLIGNLMRHKADGLVGVTNEITSYEVKRSGDLNKPHITIGNGIEVNKIKIHRLPIFTGKELQLICVSSLARRHGLDRLLKGLAIYSGGATTVHLVIVGEGIELQNLRTMVKDLKLKDNVVFTGFMSGSALDDLFDNSHIAVGSLGMHRLDMIEASILKAREYCARGIPFLCGCSDPDFPDDFPYVHKVPADDSAIDIEKIVRFAEKVYSDHEHPKKMRTFAEENLEWSKKMEKLKEFCESLVSG